MFSLHPFSPNLHSPGPTSSNQPIQSIPPERRFPDKNDLEFLDQFEISLNDGLISLFPRSEEVEPFFQQVCVPKDRLAALLRGCCRRTALHYFVPVFQSSQEPASSDTIMNWITLFQRDFEVHKKCVEASGDTLKDDSVDAFVQLLVDRKIIHHSSISASCYLDILSHLVERNNLYNPNAEGAKSFLNLAKEFSLDTPVCKNRIDNIILYVEPGFNLDIQLQLQLIKDLWSCTQETKDEVFEEFCRGIVDESVPDDIRSRYFNQAVRIASTLSVTGEKKDFEMAKNLTPNKQEEFQWCINEIQKELNKREKKPEESKWVVLV